MRPLPLISLTLSLSLSATAQSLTVPANATNRDGSGLVDAAGLERPGRVQLVIGARHLTGALGHNLIALRFRRDGSKHDLLGGSANVTVQVSASTALNPNAPSALFANNHHTTPVTVYQGAVAAPTSPRLSNRNAATWLPADVMEIAFTTPFAYAGGAVCVQLDLVPVAGSTPRWWPMDGERDESGTVVQRGSTCGSLGAQARQAASVDARSLRIGNTATFTTLAFPGSIAVLMLSGQTMGPIDLGFLGAPGCQLYVLPDVTLTTSAGAALAAGRPGAAAVALPLPYQFGLLGAQFHTQWLLAHGGTLATTNVNDVALASTPSSLDGAVIGAASRTTPLPDVGRVELMLPVMQVEHRAPN